MASKTAIVEFRYGSGSEKKPGYGSIYVIEGNKERPIWAHWELVTTNAVHRSKFPHIALEIDGAREGPQGDLFDRGLRAALADIQASEDASQLGLEILRWQWDVPLDQPAVGGSTSLIELRMRPGAYSLGGFLGLTESLESVIAQDRQALSALGISHEQIADELEHLLESVEEQRNLLLFRRDSGRDFPQFSKDCLPGTDSGYLVGDKFQFFISGSRGLQPCPWGCEPDRRSSFDFLILNRQSGEYATGPGLIIHLIRHHHFFEGRETVYRMDPAQVARVLGLVPEITLTK